jgi:hypothetical protein
MLAFLIPKIALRMPKMFKTLKTENVSNVKTKKRAFQLNLVVLFAFQDDFITFLIKTL